MRRACAAQWRLFTALLVASAALAGVAAFRQNAAEIFTEPGEVAIETARELESTLQDVLLPRPVTAVELYPLIVQRTERICHYMCSYEDTYHFEDSVVDPRWWILRDGECRIWINIQGTVFAHLDLNSIDITSLVIEEENCQPVARVTIEMNHASIAQDGFQIHHDLTTWSQPEIHAMNSSDQREALTLRWGQAQREARDELVGRAIADGLLEETEENFREDMENLLSQLGFVPDLTLVFRNDLGTASGMHSGGVPDRGRGTSTTTNRGTTSGPSVRGSSEGNGNGARPRGRRMS